MEMKALASIIRTADLVVVHHSGQKIALGQDLQNSIADLLDAADTLIKKYGAIPPVEAFAEVTKGEPG